MKRALVVVEGQTEERFVKAVLAPHFEAVGLDLRPTIVTTKVVKDGANFKGGLTNFNSFSDHVRRVLGGAGGALVTTIIDYYGLPQDFPGFQNRPKHRPPRERVHHLETSLRSQFNNSPNFHPFIALHEFEAWLFSDVMIVPTMMNSPANAPAFRALASTPPEDINESPDTAPSKRLLKMFPQYRKVQHGPIAAGRIGIEAIRDRCPHFSEWISHLEGYANSP